MKKHFRPIPLALGIFSIAMGFLLLSSCAKELTSDIPDDDSVEMIIKVGTDTKTANNGDKTQWIEGDELTVIHSSNGNDFWYSYFSWYGANAFSGKVNRLSSENDWYAVYPYREQNVSAKQINLTFPSLQTQTGNDNKEHFAGEQFPMFGKKKGVARTEELSLQMQNILAASEFKVKNTTDSPIIVKSIEFTATSPIAGAFSIDLTGDKPVLTAGTGASYKVKLSITDGDEVPAGETGYFYMAVAPFEAPAGSELTVKTVAVHPSDPGTSYTYDYTITLDEAASFSSGLVKSINVAFDDSNTPDPGTGGEVPLEPGEQPEDGVYLLVYVNGENSLAFAPMADQQSNNYAIPVTVIGNEVVPKAGQDLSRYAVTIENTGEKHACDGESWAYNVTNADGYYVFYSSDGGNSDAAIQIKENNEMSSGGTKYYHTFVQAEDGIQIRSAQNSSGAYQYLLTYSDGTGFHYSRDESDQGKKLHLYTLGHKEKQTLVFSQTSVTYDFDAGGDFPEPTLSGNMTDVTYSSSDESVAEVNPSTGEVTIKKAGYAEITATAEADDTYFGATASYTITATTNAATTFYRVTEFTAGQQYLIVSGGKALANNNGSIASVDVSSTGDVIQVADASSLTWTAASGSVSGVTLVNEGKYIQRGSSSSGKPSVGNAPSNNNYYFWTYDASNSYMSTANGTTYYLYYSSGWSQSSSASSSHTVTIYSTTKPKSSQTLSFNSASIIWTIGEGYSVGSSYAFPQTVSGNITPVTYSSSNTNAATIDGDRITITGIGLTTIKARTEGNDDYAPAEASYTLRIREQVSGDFVDLGVFNLENQKVKNFLDAAATQYTDTNYEKVGQTNALTIVANYATSVPTYSSSGSGWGGETLVHTEDRIDVPNPVTIEWETPSSGTTTITIFADQSLTEDIWTQTTTSGKTSDVVYNLIPGETYYCTVEDSSGLLLKGTFTTEGRRRMIRLSDRDGAYDRANNFRDLGGMVTADGNKRIKYGWIFRGTNLNSTTDAEQDVMANYLNIGWDIDLRQSTEGSEAFASKYGVTYVMCDYNASISALTSDVNKVKKTVMAYINAAKAGKASYFHCRIGSDRTGYWGLLIEGLLGVSVKDCSIDYELTSFANGVTSGNRTRNSGLFKDGMDFFKNKNYYNGNLEDTITQYLTNEIGISIEDINAFKNIVLEDI